MKRCPKCSYVIENEKAKFCKKCGTHLSFSEDDSPSSSDEIKKGEERTNNDAKGVTEAAFPREASPNAIDCKQKLSRKWLKENTNIKGWLSLFMVAIVIGGLISAASPIISYDADDYAGNIWLGAIDISLGICLLGIAVFTVYAFFQRKPNAVFYGRLYVILVFVTNVISVIGNEDAGFAETKLALRGIIWGAIWFVYLLLSKQVQRVIPTSYRKIFATDWVVLASVLAIPLLCFAIGIRTINTDSTRVQELETEMLSMPLDENERTDGKVIFTVPASFDCESKVVEPLPDSELTLFTLSNEQSANCYLCSDYDSDTSIDNFKEYWKNWENEQDKVLPKRIIQEGSKIINGDTCMYRIVRYNVNGIIVYWRFYILFDESSGKCCIASCYDRSESPSYIDEILNSIRFK